MLGDGDFILFFFFCSTIKTAWRPEYAAYMVEGTCKILFNHGPEKYKFIKYSKLVPLIYAWFVRFCNQCSTINT